MATTMVAGEWKIEVDGDYVYIRSDYHDGVIQVKAEIEGMAVDMFNNADASVSSCYALYEDLNGDEPDDEN